MPDFLTRRNGMWHFVRRVPKEYCNLDTRGVIRHSTKVRVASDRTGRRAMQVVDKLNAELEAHWQLIAGKELDTAATSYDQARKTARSLGFDYLDSSDIPPLPIAQRLLRLETLVLTGRENDLGACAAGLGMQPRPSFPLSKFFEEFEAITREETSKFSPNQLRVWRNSRVHAVKELIDITGDKAVTELCDNDGLDYSEWQRERVLAGEVEAGTANKSMGMLSRMLKDLSIRRALTFRRYLKALGFEARKAMCGARSTTLSYSISF
ncbi:hypothetical protein [Bradyrhizobium sp. CCBAU 21360]|uniref:hypothetical protein n=1 Tax=Bradyrhizobium sp. CCBAU 21360 TaxID=1325081 RepID=UPI00230691E0|nr:hypothetical protein [Bradyrhizobium sp. CCBAU 21360]